MTKEEKLLYAIGEIDDELVMAADAPAPKNVTAFPMNKRWKKVMLTAACFLLCIGVWASVGGMFRMGKAAPSTSVGNAKPAAPTESLIPESAEEEFDEVVTESEATAEESPAEAPAAKAEEASPETGGAEKCPVNEETEVFYINYQAPILPLDISGESEDLSAERILTINVDAQYDDVNQLEACDEYLLKNSGDVDQTVTLSYNFSGNFRSVNSVSMEVEGSSESQNLNASLSYSGFTEDGMNIDHFNNWNDWVKEFPGEIQSVNDEVPAYANELITVYELYDAEISADAPEAACIAVEFDCDEDTLIWNNNFNGMSIDGNRRIYDVFAKSYARRPEMSKSLWVFGGKELQNLEIKGYTNGACEVEYDGVTAKLRSYQTTLKEAVSQSIWQFAAENDIKLERIDEETLTNAVLQYLRFSQLGDEPQLRYDYLSSWELNSDIMAVERIFTLEQTVTIPANGSVKVEVQLQREPNWTLESSQTCIDAAATLGSNLKFDSAIVNFVGADTVIVNGGNLNEGENQIDPDVERWYVTYAEAELCDGVPLKN